MKHPPRLWGYCFGTWAAGPSRDNFKVLGVEPVEYVPLTEFEEIRKRLEEAEGLLLRLLNSEALKEAPFYFYSEAVADTQEYFAKKPATEGK